MVTLPTKHKSNEIEAKLLVTGGDMVTVFVSLVTGIATDCHHSNEAKW